MKEQRFKFKRRWQIMFSIFDGMDAKCLFLSQSKVLAHTLPIMLVENDATVTCCEDYSEFMRHLDAIPGINFAFIDVDSFGGIAAQYDRIREMRGRFPDVATILVSSDFSTDEFGTHRLFLADVSLRLPVTYSCLELALLQAPVNNRVWVQRLNSAFTHAPTRSVAQSLKLGQRDFGNHP